MTAPQFFRFLLIARIVFPLFFYATGLVPWRSHRLSESVGPVFALLIELPLAVAGIVLIVGLWQFRWWARIGYVAAAVVYALAVIFFPSRDPCEYSPVVGSFAYLGLASQVVLITMMFLPPVSHRFEYSET